MLIGSVSAGQKACPLLPDGFSFHVKYIFAVNKYVAFFSEVQAEVIKPVKGPQKSSFPAVRGPIIPSISLLKTLMFKDLTL